MPETVFVSYSSKDQKIAEGICEALEHRGVDCWISSRNIAPGENFQEAIVGAIRAARVMVLIFSANANNSDEIKKELVLAGQSNLTVIPIRVEDVTPGAAFAYEFATRQWVDLYKDWERAIEQLVSQIGRVTPQSDPRAAPRAGVGADASAMPAAAAEATLSAKIPPPSARRPAAAPKSPPAPAVGGGLQPWHWGLLAALILVGAAAGFLAMHYKVFDKFLGAAGPASPEVSAPPVQAPGAPTVRTPGPPPVDTPSAPTGRRPAVPDAFKSGIPRATEPTIPQASKPVVPDPGKPGVSDVRKPGVAADEDD